MEFHVNIINYFLKNKSKRYQIIFLLSSKSFFVQFFIDKTWYNQNKFLLYSFSSSYNEKAKIDNKIMFFFIS